MNENDIDVKLDFDPTDPTDARISLNFITDITYKQIYLEIARFIHDNNNDNSGRYLEYPKLCLMSNKPKCKKKSMCGQCGENSKNSMFSVCATKRRQIANQLFIIGKERECMSNSLSRIAKQLLLPDQMLIQESNKYKLNCNWFVKTYSFLKWRQEIAHTLLHNLVHDKNIKMEENVFLFKFNVLTKLYSYLDQLIECFVIFYCCFDANLWISIFYPFIEASIGTLQCNLLLAQSQQQHQQHEQQETQKMTSICDEAFKSVTDIWQIEKQKQQQLGITDRCSKEMKAISIFKQILCDVYEQYDQDQDEDNMTIKSNNPFDLTHKIYLKLNDTITNTKTQLATDQMTGQSIHGSNSDAKQHLNEERKDDWAVDAHYLFISNRFKTKMTTPSFIRLFIIKRIIDKYIKSKNATTIEKQKVAMIKELVNVFNDNRQQLERKENDDDRLYTVDEDDDDVKRQEYLTAGATSTHGGRLPKELSSHNGNKQASSLPTASNEKSIKSCYAVVYEFENGTWKVSGEGGWSEVHLCHDSSDNSYRILAWTVKKQKVNLHILLFLLNYARMCTVQ